MSVCGRQMACCVWEVRAIVANAIAKLDVVQQLADKALVRVLGQFVLELEWLYWSDQLLLVNG